MLFEVALGFLGLFVSWLARIELSDLFTLTHDAFLRGILACLPMLVILFASYETPWRPLVKLRRDVEKVVHELFGSCRWWELALVSLAAGIGEETLFRGALQPLVASWTTDWSALVVVALLFGLAHAMSTAYFVAATIIGGFLGWLALAYHDLTAPTVAHALYDFVALVTIQARSRGKRSDPPAK